MNSKSDQIITLSAKTDVAVFFYPELHAMIMAVAKNLKDMHGMKLHLICNSEDDEGFCRKNYNFVDGEIICFGPLMHNPKHISLYTAQEIEDLKAKGRNLEKKYGTTISFMAMPSRVYGRGFSPGGIGHPYSSSAKDSNWLNMLEAYINYFTAVENLVQANNIGLFLQADSRESNLIALNNNIPVRILVTTPVGTAMHWSPDEKLSFPFLSENYDAAESLPLSDSQAPADELTAVYTKHISDAQATLERWTWFGTMRRLCFLTTRWVYWKLRGYKKAKSFDLISNLKASYQIRIQLKDIYRYCQSSTTIKDSALVLFGLHEEPESALAVMSPNAFNQLAIIGRIARDLPAGYILGVKEHIYSIGRRPVQFYQQIAEYKNVVLIDPRESARDIMPRCSAVCVIAGTMGFEAAQLGKPVLIFGDYVYYSIIEGTRKVHSGDDLMKIFSDLLESPPDPNSTKASAAILRQVIENISFDVPREMLRDEKAIDPGVVDRCVLALEESFVAPSP